MSNTKIKICGLYRSEDIAMINQEKPDFCGFIIDFPKSHRNRTPDEVRELVKELDKDIIPVGVFVNEDNKIIEELLNDGTIEIAQLHGSETEEDILNIKKATNKPVSKAFKIVTSEDVQKALDSSADYILLDQGQGEGKSFDWSVITEEQKLALATKRWFLAGGIGIDNVSVAIEKLNPWGVDLSSAVETEKIKDQKKVNALITKVKNA